MSVRYLSLFSGCGGLDAGLKNAGLKCSLAVDNDAHAIATHSRNLDRPTQRSDLSHFDTGSFPDHDLLVAGPPCQGFSTIGANRDNDPRNELLVVPARIACETKPSMVVVENVPGIRSTRHRKFLDKSESLLRSNGYKTMTVDVDMRDFGLVQRRRRVIMFAWLGSNEFRFGPPTNSSVKDLSTVISGADFAPNHDPKVLTRGQDDFIVAAHIKPGQKLSNVRLGASSVHTWQIPKVFGVTSAKEQSILVAVARLRRRLRTRDWGDADPVKASDVSSFVGFSSNSILKELVHKGYVRRIDNRFDLRHTFNGKYRRASDAVGAPAVDSHFGNPKYVLHPCEPRGFSVREAARIQGFEDDFVFEGPLQSQYLQVANAVPPPVGEVIGHAASEFVKWNRS